jgi:hypothetical protein
MGEGDKPNPRGVAAPAARDRLRATEKSIAKSIDKASEKSIARPAGPPGAAAADRKNLAVGTVPAPNAPLVSRTATLDDPLTTSLLAEITRRSRTIDVSPDQIAEAVDLDPAELAELDPFADLADEPPTAPRGDPLPRR